MLWKKSYLFSSNSILNQNLWECSAQPKKKKEKEIAPMNQFVDEYALMTWIIWISICMDKVLTLLCGAHTSLSTRL